jgi:hypothetical protein
MEIPGIGHNAYLLVRDRDNSVLQPGRATDRAMNALTWLAMHGWQPDFFSCGALLRYRQEAAN